MLRVTMSRKTRAVLLGAISVLGIACLLILVFLSGRGSGYPPLPNPNGYDDFARAGQAIVGDPTAYSDMDQPTLAGLISSNAEPLRLIDLGLTRRCSFPTELGVTNFSLVLGDLGNLKRLAQLLRAQGRLAEMEDKPEEAARAYVTGLRFGNEICRGGFLINRLVAIACEAIAGTQLAKLAGRLNCDQARPLLAQMETMDRDRVTFQEVRGIEKRIFFHEMLKQHNPAQMIISWLQVRATVQRTEARHNAAVAHERLLLIELALRCYQSEHGNPPTTLDQLVPTYLSRVPLDPFSGQPFRYQPQGSTWIAYSVGADGVDDGGKPANRGAQSRGDVLYNSAW
jgi:hypothetical protein